MAVATTVVLAGFGLGTAAAQPEPMFAVLASTTLATVVDVPYSFQLLQVSVPAGQTVSAATGAGMIFQLSGSQTITAGGETRAVQPQQGLFVAADVPATLRAAAGQPSSFLEFVLLPAAEAGQAPTAMPASVRELFRSPAPLPGLQPGPYTFDLSLVTFPPGMPRNPPHHRSGAALYYVLSGTGEFTAQGRSETRPPGAIQYEPADLLHQWANPGSQPLTFVVANLNPVGVPAVEFTAAGGAAAAPQVPSALPRTGEAPAAGSWPILAVGLGLGLAGAVLRRRNPAS